MPSSMRPGGTTHFFVEEGIEPDRLTFWGRWASNRSLKHYIQESIAAQLLLTSPFEAHRIVHALLTDCCDMLEIPSQPWWHFCSRPDVRPSDRNVKALKRSKDARWKDHERPLQI